MQPHSSQNNLRLLIIFAVLVNFSGLFVHLMDPDAGVYASISKNMVLQNDWWNLTFQDKDWLDKPHFPFWVTAVFFKLFGLQTWAYKLPGILFALLGARYTYLFARKFYDENTALLSAFILLTSLHFLISNNDVRAEPFLTGMIIASIYHFSNCIPYTGGFESLSHRKRWIIELILGSLFAAMAMMTKGLFTLAPIGAAVGGHLLITRQWKQIFHIRWILAGVLILIFITPELYALWLQFDSHPEKIMYGKDHVSGIRFFLWDSQFGRFMNTGPIKGKGDPSFFLHTLLWAFLPWCLLMYAAFYKRIMKLFRAPRSYPEWYLFCGALFSILIFSVSKFQLPYYTNIIFPILAVLTAAELNKYIINNNRPWRITHNVISLIALLLVAALWVFYRPAISMGPIIVFALLLSIAFYLVNHTESSARAYLRSGAVILVVALFMNLIFYPDLLRYQSGNQLAFYVNKHFPNDPIGRTSFYMPSGEFYLKQHIQALDTQSIKQFPKGGLVYLSEEDKTALEKTGIPFEELTSFEEYHITMLKLKFLDPSKRASTLKHYYLIRLR